MFRINLCFLLLLIASCTSKPPQHVECVERRSVIEMGSNRIKLTVADVDFCKVKFIQVVEKKDWKIEQDNNIQVEKDGSRTISTLVEDQTIKAFEDAKQVIASYPKTKEPQVIATGVFREVSKLDSYFDRIMNVIGVKPRVLTALEEARVGVKSLMATEDHLPEQFLVWDIGGNSMQIILKQNKKSRYFLGGKGSQFYKNLGLNILGKKDSPNPVGQKNIAKLKAEFLKAALGFTKFKDIPPSITVYGIGGLHKESILKRLDNPYKTVSDAYTRDELHQMTLDSASLNDVQLGGSFSANQVTNQILVETLMDYLKIDKVNVRSLDLTQGTLVFGVEKF